MFNNIETTSPKLIDFKKITSKKIHLEAQNIISKTDAKIQKLCNLDKDSQNFNNTVIAFDNIQDELEHVLSVIYLMAYVNPNAKIRQEAQKQIAELSRYINRINLDENLYKTIKKYTETPDYKKLTGYKKRFTDKIVLDFERNGFALQAPEREKLKALKDQLAEIEIAFDTAIAEHQDHLILSEEEMDGLPEEFCKARLTPEGNYKVNLSSPSYKPFMSYAKNDDLRKQLMFKFLNKAAPQNCDNLQKILELRHKQAQILGYSNYAEFAIGDKMAKKAEIVWKFEKDLQKKVTQKAEQDIAVLQEIKDKTAHAKSSVKAWQSSFYENILLEEKYKLDQRKVKQYFELENVINGIFEISSRLFGVDFRPLPQVSCWHENVRAFEICKDKQPVGFFYLDLYPRENKYDHAAMFPILSGKAINGAYRPPMAALVCNFTPPTDEMPSLLPHSDVVTLFHEFGHLLHGLLTRSPIASIAGTSVARDFVETPSQLFENWAWEYDSLKLFAKHYKTGTTLPKKLHNKMLAAKNVGSGIHTLQQLFYGQLDLSFHGDFIEQKTDTTALVKKLQNEITPFEYMEGTHFEAGFGHLNGYSAAYYGYLWSKVYAEDVFSVFKESGILNPEIGRKYLQDILSQGSTLDEMEQLRKFLNREPNQEAFIRSIGL